MALTPETLPRHELNGLPVRVVAADNADLVGIAGRVVLETTKTLLVDRGQADGGGESRVSQVPKRGTTFEFALDGEDGSLHGEDGHGLDSEDGAAPLADADARESTDEAAGAREGPGTASEPVSTPDNPERDRDEAGYGVAYVTVDGTRLLSRPALRTENDGDSPWR